MERLDKLIAKHAGCTRKEAKQHIAAGQVTLDGAVQTRPEAPVDPATQTLCLAGRPLTLQQHLYFMQHKPAGVLCAAKDATQPTVVDLLPEELKKRGLMPVGRLDKDTTGLLLFTDDGDFAHRVLSAKQRVYKTYHLCLERPLEAAQIEKLVKGITLQDGTVCLPAKVELLPGENRAALSICEGKYHQVKRMLAACGNRVTALHRASIGGLQLEEALPAGAGRLLTEEECARIFAQQR